MYKRQQYINVFIRHILYLQPLRLPDSLSANIDIDQWHVLMADRIAALEGMRKGPNGPLIGFSAEGKCR